MRWKHYRRYLADGSKEVWWKSIDPTTGKWANGLFGRTPASLPLWNWHRLKSFPPDAPIVLTEGEPAAQALDAIGICAVATVCGAEIVPDRSVLEILAGRHVIIWRDHDRPGALHMGDIARELADGIATSLRWVSWPDAPPKGDAADFVRLHGADATRDIIARAQVEMPPIPAPSADGDPTYARRASGSAHGKRPTHGELLERAVRDAQEQGDAELFHDPDSRAYITLRVGEHRETLLVKGRGFRSWLSAQFFRRHGKAPSTQAMQEFLGALEGQALYAGPEHPTFVRVGSHGGNIYLDLGDSAWRCVEITPAGWLIVPHPDRVKFRRAAGMGALPLPVPGGNLNELRRFVNVEDDDQWRLACAWEVGAVRDRGPYSILALLGEHGSAKSTTARMLRALIDPNTVALRASPREERDLAVGTRHSWVLALDNISRLHPWVSDALCRISTGAGFAARTLYSDEDETLLGATRPIIVTGIGEFATQPDFLDRALILKLPPIREYREEADLWPEFEIARPALLGALLDVVVAALAHLPHVRSSGLPRMADFAKWAVAAEPALGWPQGSFLAAYIANRVGANQTALEGSVVAADLLTLLDDPSRHGSWEGTVGELLDVLTQRAGDRAKVAWWPRSARALRGALDRITSNLRAAGVEILTLPRTGRERRLVIKKGRDEIVTTVTSSQTRENKAPRGDGLGDGPVAVPETVTATAAGSDGLDGGPEIVTPDRHLASPIKSRESDEVTVMTVPPLPLLEEGAPDPTPGPGHPSHPCPVCGGARFWRGASPKWICTQCHKPAVPGMAVAWADVAPTLPAGDEGGRVDLKHVPDLVPPANPMNSTKRDEGDVRDEVPPALSTDPLAAEAARRFGNAVVEVRSAPGTEEEETSP